jgi:hypothetical protein
MAIGAGIAAAGAIASGVIGSRSAKKAAEAQIYAMQQALAYQSMQVDKAVKELEKIGIPSVEAQQIVLQNPQLAGLEEIIELPESEITQIQRDADLAMQQRQALETLSEMGEAGLTPEEKAARREMMRDVSAQVEARDKAILQSMQERGMAGSGAELAQRLAASQAGAERAGKESASLAAQANKRALEAMMSRGELAGKIRGQEFGEELQKAQAADAIAKFNVQQRADVQARNLARKQALLDERRKTAIAQETYNKQLQQQQFENQLRLAQAKASALTGSAQMVGGTMSRMGDPAAAYQTAKGGALGQAIGGVTSAIGGYMASRPQTTQTQTAPQTTAYNWQAPTGSTRVS